MKRNGYFTFQTIIDITGTHGAISFFQYAWIAEVLLEFVYLFVIRIIHVTGLVVEAALIL